VRFEANKWQATLSLSSLYYLRTDTQVTERRRAAAAPFWNKKEAHTYIVGK
jgi:hypothetical protein